MASFPPVPDWKPAFAQPLDDVVECYRRYTNGTRDFAVFANGTGVVLESGLSEADASARALQALAAVFNAHPDMNPMPMKDGNVLVQYKQSVINVVLASVTQAHWAEIEARHLDALATSEVLITPLGQNKFDDVGKKALFGRCYMFMDAQNPKVVRLERKVA